MHSTHPNILAPTKGHPPPKAYELTRHHDLFGQRDSGFSTPVKARIPLARTKCYAVQRVFNDKAKNTMQYGRGSGKGVVPLNLC